MEAKSAHKSGDQIVPEIQDVTQSELVELGHLVSDVLFSGANVYVHIHHFLKHKI